MGARIKSIEPREKIFLGVGKLIARWVKVKVDLEKTDCVGKTHGTITWEQELSQLKQGKIFSRHPKAKCEASQGQDRH